MGALGGHMAHLSEDLDLTFNEIVEVLGKVANAEIEAVTEKVDGQNLFLTVTESGDIRAARNNSDVAAGGMTTEEYASKWRGHPAESAFTNGFKAISTALRKLSPETLEDVFADGDRYVNMEIMYPKNPNIILYSAPQVVLHALRYMGGESAEDLTAEEREELNRLQKVANEKFPALVKAVDGAEEQVGEELWTINGPKLVALKKLADGTALAEVAAKIEAFASPVGMDAQLKDYVELVVRKYADQVGLPEDRVDNLLLLMLDREKAEEKGITVNVVKKGLPKELKPVVSKLATITNARKYISTILHPVEVAISDFAIEVLRGVKSFFVDEHDKEVIRMRNELEKSIIYLKGLQDSGDVKMGELMDKQLAKLGDIENLASTMEGVVFEYPPGSGNTYKLTGAFAMANQIIGRARRSGMNEDLSGEFTINISSDRTMTKSLAEWLEEIESAEHSYTKLPQTVYEDILSGGMIVDIVEQENALPTVYNTVLTYVNSLREEDEVDLEVVEPPKTIAIVPGAFKPPHLGHLAMVEQYAAMADEVIVLISNPLKAQRELPNGRQITAEDSLKIWQLLTAGMPNVTVRIFDDPEIRSPISAAYLLAGAPEERERAALKTKPPLPPIPAESTIILGASRKDGDWKRWSNAEKYIGGGRGGDLYLSPPEETAQEPTYRPDGETPYSATDLRNALGDPVNNRAEIAEFVGEENVDAVLDILQLQPPPLKEESGVSAVGGYSLPLGSTLVRGQPPKKKKKKKDTRKENIDLSLVEEVLELLIGRGI